MTPVVLHRCAPVIRLNRKIPECMFGPPHLRCILSFLSYCPRCHNLKANHSMPFLLWIRIRAVTLKAHAESEVHHISLAPIVCLVKSRLNVLTCRHNMTFSVQCDYTRVHNPFTSAYMMWSRCVLFWKSAKWPTITCLPIWVNYMAQNHFICGL